MAESLICQVVLNIKQAEERFRPAVGTSRASTQQDGAMKTRKCIHLEIMQ